MNERFVSDADLQRILKRCASEAGDVGPREPAQVPPKRLPFFWMVVFACFLPMRTLLMGMVFILGLRAYHDDNER